MTSLRNLDVQQLLAAEPFVRSLARSLVADDADEVVQQVWLRALRRDGPRVRDPRRWLAQVVRSVAANLHRTRARRRLHERAAARTGLVPSSLQLAELEDRRRSLVAAVDTLPEELRAVVLLRYYGGLPPRAIARELGLPVTVVWRQQQRALAILRQRLIAAAGGDRSRWRSALAPVAMAPRALPWRELIQPATPALWTGVLAMTTKAKILCGAAVLMAMTLTLGLWGGGVPADVSQAEGAAPPALAQARSPVVESPVSAAPVAVAPAPDREAVPAAEPRDARGTLVVHVRYADDQTPVADVEVLAWASGSNPVTATRRVTTDDGGAAVFADLPAGRMLVTTGRSLATAKAAEVPGGATCEVALELAGITVTGIVIDSAATPIAAAVVETMPPLATRPEAVAVTGPDGRFRVRALRAPFVVGARAAGLASSECQIVMPDADPAEVQIVLAAVGGMVEGRVSGPDGPVVDAVVQVGHHSPLGRTRNPPLPAMVHTDREGRFRALGLAVGEQPVQVRAAGFAPWRGTCTVVAQQATALQVQLELGATIRGVVRAADHSPLSRATVSVGDSADLLARSGTRSGSDGSFVLTDLPAGEVSVRATHDRAGEATLSVRTEAGTVTDCELQLSRGLELRGRVLREDDTPVPDARVTCWGGGILRATTTDALGRFTIGNCPEGKVGVRVEGSEIERLLRSDLDPRAGDVELRVRSVGAPSARLTGVLVDPGGQPLAGVTVLAGREGQSVTRRLRAATTADGRFAFAPLVPGRWYLTVAAAGHRAPYEGGPFELAADADLDVGTILVVLGGALRVRILRGDPSGVQFEARRPDGGPRGPELRLGAGEITARPLEPGAYELAVFGNGTAEQTVPFVIGAEEETRFDLSLERGVRQCFELALPTGSASGGRVQLVVHRGEEFVARRSVGAAKGATEAWLAPGRYRVTATLGSFRGEATFGVGSVEGPPVRVDLR